ncbi:helix-turn-helix domain-containing protein [Candidatus Woesearchaeota archaeon]|nr:helix-turn-helix domain-containing protein [Candidatus Woesearchaeota archaeon]
MSENPLFKEIKQDLKRLEKKYDLNAKEILNIIGKETTKIPFSIFNMRLGSLEGIVKYLDENGFSLKEISYLLNREVKPLRTTLGRANRKYPWELDKSSKKTIPISIFQNKKLSVLENLISHLHKKGFTLTEISGILKRDYQTIWTVMQRIKKK